MKILLTIILALFTCLASAQVNPNNMFESYDDDLEVGGDIFSNFNEDLEASQVLEDERFYRYGRFFSVNIGLGLTRFTGNRGSAYEYNSDPTFSFSVSYFFNFLTAFSLGIDYSKHSMFIDTVTAGQKQDPYGAIETSFLRPFFSFKFYMDTADYGNAITYSNPHLIMRLEYWYQTNKFIDRPDLGKESGGGIGTGLGGGLEFPIRLKEAYLGVEFLWHWVNFFDKFTQNYRAINTSDTSKPTFEDLTGSSWTIMMSYNITW